MPKLVEFLEGIENIGTLDGQEVGGWTEVSVVHNDACICSATLEDILSSDMDCLDYEVASHQFGDDDILEVTLKS